MDWNWIQEHPAEAAWYAFGLLSVLAVAYGRMEPKLKAWAGRSDNTVDDKLVWGLSHTIGLLTLVLDILRELAPTFIGAHQAPVPSLPHKPPADDAEDSTSSTEDPPTDTPEDTEESEE